MGLLDTIKQSKLAYFGHLMKHASLQLDLIDGKIEGKRARGRPRLKWLDNIKEWSTTPKYVDLKKMAQDRQRWRLMIGNILEGESTND
eukprot:gene6693-12250_t